MVGEHVSSQGAILVIQVGEVWNVKEAFPHDSPGRLGANP